MRWSAAASILLAALPTSQLSAATLDLLSAGGTFTTGLLTPEGGISNDRTQVFDLATGDFSAEPVRLALPQDDPTRPSFQDTGSASATLEVRAGDGVSTLSSNTAVRGGAFRRGSNSNEVNATGGRLDVAYRFRVDEEAALTLMLDAARADVPGSIDLTGGLDIRLFREDGAETAELRRLRGGLDEGGSSLGRSVAFRLDDGLELIDIRNGRVLDDNGGFFSQSSDPRDNDVAAVAAEPFAAVLQPGVVYRLETSYEAGVIALDARGGGGSETAGRVDNLTLRIAATATTPAAVPSPSAAGAAALMAGGLLARRRRA